MSKDEVSGSGRLALPAEGSLRQGLLTALSEVLAYADEQRQRDDITKALHEFRKSVRRTRSALRMMEGFVGIDAYQAVASTLRELHRSTSDLRDQHVIGGVLGDFRDRLEPGGEAERAARALEAAVSELPVPAPADIVEVMAAGTARFPALPRLLGGAMPRKVVWEAVERGLADTYRRAKRDLRAVRKGADDDTVHSLRKRIKELNYQVELFYGLGGKAVHKRKKLLARLASELGHVADLIVLSSFGQEHLSESQGCTAFLEAVCVARENELARAVTLAREALDNAPKKFARAVVGAARKGHG